jgi:Fe-S-cluster containining protein
MNRAQRRKKNPKPRRPKGASRGSQPAARVNPSVAAVAHNNVVEIIGQGLVPDRALEIAVSAFFLADHLTRRLEAEQELPQPVACQEECDACCYNRVEVTPPEALIIAHHIAGNFSPAEKEVVLANLAQNLVRTRGKSPAAVAGMRAELPCPLLRDRRCSVYPVRPLVCRAMHSLDRERCASELCAGSLAASPYYAHRHEIAVSVSAGLREGCRAAGLQSGTLNLAQALDDFSRQENPIGRWINGEEVFGA